MARIGQKLKLATEKKMQAALEKQRNERKEAEEAKEAEEFHQFDTNKYQDIEKMNFAKSKAKKR